MALGTVYRLLSSPAVGISWKLRVRWAADTAAAIAYLHSNRVMHRDLKSTNLLVDDSYVSSQMAISCAFAE